MSSDVWIGAVTTLGRATREFQNAARNELDVAGPAEPRDDAARPVLDG